MSYIAHVTEGTGEFHSNNGVTCDISCEVPSPKQLPYSGKFLWGPNFILFILSLSERKFNTQNVCYDGHVVFPV